MNSIIEQSGGADGIRDLGLAESALAQPQMSFGGVDLYPTLAERAAALCYSPRDIMDILKLIATVERSSFYFLEAGEAPKTLAREPASRAFTSIFDAAGGKAAKVSLDD